jgi:hypothetical protein
MSDERKRELFEGRIKNQNATPRHSSVVRSSPPNRGRKVLHHPANLLSDPPLASLPPKECQIKEQAGRGTESIRGILGYIDLHHCR